VVKVVKHHAMKAYGGVDIYIHVFLTSALVGGEWSASRPGRFTPWNPLYRRLGGVGPIFQGYYFPCCDCFSNCLYSTGIYSVVSYVHIWYCSRAYLRFKVFEVLRKTILLKR
jgi:hypothetical protein